MTYNLGQTYFTRMTYNLGRMKYKIVFLSFLFSCRFRRFKSINDVNCEASIDDNVSLTSDDSTCIPQKEIA